MENWKEIPFEDNYEVSNKGQIRNKHTKHIKSLRNDRYGYKRVTLYPSGKTYTIHRIVGLVFLEKEKYEEINHINGDKTDNRVENLEWCDGSHNARHRDTKLRSKWKGNLNPNSKLTTEIVKKIKYSNFNNLNNRQIGDIFNVSSEVVRRIRNNQRWNHI